MGLHKGMLLQEHVAQLLKPRVPDGWEESMDQGWEGEGAGEVIDDEQMGVEDGGQDEEGSSGGRDKEARETEEEEEEEDSKHLFCVMISLVTFVFQTRMIIQKDPNNGNP